MRPRRTIPQTSGPSQLRVGNRCFAIGVPLAVVLWIVAGTPAMLLAEDNIGEALQPAPPQQPRPAALVTNTWIETDIRAVVQDIVAQTNVQIIVGPLVQGVVSMQVKDMPLQQCLQRLVKVGNYAFARVDDYYVIGSGDPNSPIFYYLCKRRRIKLQHTEARTVQNLLPAALARYVSIDAKSNIVLIVAPNHLFDTVLDIINSIDVPAQQVVVEALVVEVSERGRRELGIDWHLQEGKADVGFQNLLGTGTYLRSGTAMTKVNLTLKALVTREEAKILATPRITVLDGHEASIYVGEDKYYSLLHGAANNPYYRMERIQIGVKLKVTPHITQGGVIELDLEPEVSNVNIAATASDSNLNSRFPVVTRRNVRTHVRIRNGHTLVIGGLLHEETRRIAQKVPILGSIPLVGLLFRTRSDVREQKEVIIFITPRLVEEDGDPHIALPDNADDLLTKE